MNIVWIGRMRLYLNVISVKYNNNTSFIFLSAKCVITLLLEYICKGLHDLEAYWRERNESPWRLNGEDI